MPSFGYSTLRLPGNVHPQTRLVSHNLQTCDLEDVEVEGTDFTSFPIRAKYKVLVCSNRELRLSIATRFPVAPDFKRSHCRCPTFTRPAQAGPVTFTLNNLSHGKRLSCVTSLAAVWEDSFASSIPPFSHTYQPFYQNHLIPHHHRDYHGTPQLTFRGQHSSTRFLGSFVYCIAILPQPEALFVLRLNITNTTSRHC